MQAGNLVVDLEELVSRIPDGASLAIPAEYSGCAAAAVRALIRRGCRDLHLIPVPTGGFMADWLIGAGCVTSVEAAAMTLGEHGTPPRFSAAIREGRIRMKDSTCPAIHAGLQAAEKGIPFIPLRGILGSDLLRYRSDWRVINNPFSEHDDPIVLLPAIRPDVALIHARAADRHGNVWVGVRREMMLMAHAAQATLVTVERIEDTDFLTDDAMAAGTIPALYISALSVVPGGARPIGLAGSYPADGAELAEYAKVAKTEEGFRRWADRAIYGKVPA